MDIFQELGKVQSPKERFTNIHRGFAIVYIVLFNMLWLILSDPTALLLWRTEVISIASCSEKHLSEIILLHTEWNSGKLASLSTRNEIEEN